MDLIGTELLDRAIAANGIAAVAALGKLNGLLVDLCQVDIPFTRTTPVADLVAGLADYVGYAQGTVTWLAPSRDDAGAIEVVGTLAEWRPTNAVTPNLIYGLFCRAAVGGDLLLVARFDDSPLPMGDALDSILVTMRWRPATDGVAAVVS